MALGHDGIPKEFFKKCWVFIGEEFCDMITKSLEKNEFHSAMTKGIICLILKESLDLKELDFW